MGNRCGKQATAKWVAAILLGSRREYVSCVRQGSSTCSIHSR